MSHEIAYGSQNKHHSDDRKKQSPSRRSKSPESLRRDQAEAQTQIGVAGLAREDAQANEPHDRIAMQRGGEEAAELPGGQRDEDQPERHAGGLGKRTGCPQHAVAPFTPVTPRLETVSRPHLHTQRPP